MVWLKVLWIVNVPLPEISNILGETPSPFGGWLDYTSQDISQRNEIELHIAFPHKENVEQGIHGENIKYWPFKSLRFTPLRNIENEIRQIIDKVMPDLVHIFGTELDHSYLSYKVLNTISIPYVVSIQGLVGYIHYHYEAYLPYQICKKKSVRNLILGDNILSQKQRFHERGLKEREIIENSKYIVGRTTWDKAISMQINSNIHYYHLNESLRKKFYENKWSYESCDKKTIFVSQASYPVKGFHILVEALPLILKKYPETKVYVAGINPTSKKGFYRRFKRDYYGVYLEKRIKELNLWDNIIFLGPLNEERMVSQFLKSNVFVSPSSIENSPNSVGEAMLLGVPIVSSYVGGVMDFIEHEKEGFLYQADAHYMLAHYVCRVFALENKISKISTAARRRAIDTHDLDRNNRQLVQIYEKIIHLERKK